MERTTVFHRDFSLLCLYFALSSCARPYIKEVGRTSAHLSGGWNQSHSQADLWQDLNLHDYGWEGSSHSIAPHNHKSVVFLFNIRLKRKSLKEKVQFPS